MPIVSFHFRLMLLLYGARCVFLIDAAAIRRACQLFFDAAALLRYAIAAGDVTAAAFS